MLRRCDRRVKLGVKKQGYIRVYLQEGARDASTAITVKVQYGASLTIFVLSETAIYLLPPPSPQPAWECAGRYKLGLGLFLGGGTPHLKTIALMYQTICLTALPNAKNLTLLQTSCFWWKWWGGVGWGGAFQLQEYQICYGRWLI